MNWPASPEKVSCIAWPVSDAVTLDAVPTARFLTTGVERVRVIVPEPLPVCWTTIVYVPPVGSEPKLMTDLPEYPEHPIPLPPHVEPVKELVVRVVPSGLSTLKVAPLTPL
jgi:hypothetical protein